MKKILSVILFVGALLNSFSQTPGWDWAKQGVGNGVGKSVATDISGNVYATGIYIDSTITFNPFVLQGLVNWKNVYVVKYDSSGNIVWARNSVPSTNVFCNGIATDNFGNIYITGWFTNQISFGSFTLYSSGTYNIFLVKYDSSGNVLWAKRAGGTLSCSSNSVATDPGGNVFIAGGFESPLFSFDTITLSNTSGGSEIFLAKYDSSGNILWAKNAIGNNSDEALGLATDATGNAYITGNLLSGSIQLDTLTLVRGSVNGDVFLIKFNSAGNAVWGRRASNWAAEGYSVATTSAGKIIITGTYFSSSITFGTHTISNNSTSGPSNMFIAEYDSTGNALWARGTSTTSVGFYGISGNSVAADNAGNCYVIGEMDPNIATTFSSITVTLTGGLIFIAKYNASGNIMWVKTLKGGSNEMEGITTDNTGDIFVTGNISANNLVVGNDILIRSGTHSPFIAKMGHSLGFPPAQPSIIIGSTNVCEGSSTVYSVTNDTSATSYSWTLPNTWSGVSDSSSIIATAGATSGTVTATAYNAYGSGIPRTLNVSGSARPIVTFAPLSTVCTYHPAYPLTGGSPMGGAYSGQGVSANFFSPSLVGAGTYMITYTYVSGACIVKDSVPIIVDLCTGLDALTNDGGISIAPNPATSSFTITTTSKIKEIKMMNVMGEHVLAPPPFFKEGAGGWSVDVSSLSKGIYFLQVMDEKKNVVNKKVVVQ